MKKNVITISRQFGSGGRTIGRELANRLGIPFYDKELVEQIALESGFSTQYIEENGEHAPNKNRFAYAFSGTGGHGFLGGMTTADFLWTIQCNVIMQLADKGPCVIVGRNADYILKDRKDCLHVYIHADEDFRADRIVRLYGESEKSPMSRLQEKDKRRTINYEHYTGRTWGKAANYDISLNSGVIGVSQCVDILVNLCQDD